MLWCQQPRTGGGNAAARQRPIGKALGGWGGVGGPMSRRNRSSAKPTGDQRPSDPAINAGSCRCARPSRPRHEFSALKSPCRRIPTDSRPRRPERRASGLAISHCHIRTARCSGPDCHVDEEVATFKVERGPRLRLGRIRDSMRGSYSRYTVGDTESDVTVALRPAPGVLGNGDSWPRQCSGDGQGA